jgi:hypothetical protein
VIGATLSPDGSQLAYLTSGGLFVSGVDGQGARRLVAAGDGREPRFIAWSPDGTRVVYAENDSERRVAAVDVVALSGARRHVADSPLSEQGTLALTWTDARHVAYTLGIGSRHDPGADLVEQAVADDGAPVGPPRRLWQWPDADPMSFAVTRGAIAAVMSTPHDEVRVADLGPDGLVQGAPRAATREQADEMFAGFLPDGRLLTTARRVGGAELFVHSPEGEPVSVAPAPIESAVALRDGSVVAWRDDARGCRLVRVDIGERGEAGEARETLLGAASTRGASGELPQCLARIRCGAVCFVSRREGEEVVYARFDPRTGRIGAAVYRVPAERAAGWDASPDGAELALGGEGITWVDVASGNARARPPSGHVGSVQFAPDGRNVLVGAYLANGWVIERIDRAGARRRLWSSDAEWLAFPRLDASGRRLYFGSHSMSGSVRLLTPRSEP